MIRKKNIYTKGITKNFRISRSKVDLHIKCKRCFWLDRVKGLGMIQPPSFTLNNAVDNLLKNEFDFYRSAKKKHPIFIKNDLNIIPFSHPNLNEWRENFKGISYTDTELDLVFTGAIDDKVGVIGIMEALVDRCFTMRFKRWNMMKSAQKCWPNT